MPAGRPKGSKNLAPRSDEYRQKLSDALTGRKLPPEVRQKMSESHQAYEARVRRALALEAAISEITST